MTRPGGSATIARKVLTLTALLVAILLGVATPASATWSVVGTDQETGEVGVAIASCVPASALGNLDQPLVPVVLVPNQGAGVTQALINIDAARRIRKLIELGRTPVEIVDDVSSSEFDADFASRQHGVVTFSGLPSGFTGDDNSPIALDAQAAGVSVQGNILVSEGVVEDALAAFEDAEGKQLADRLVAALVAGGAAGGDSRCGDQTALFAHLAVASPDDDPLAPSIMLTIARPEEGENPVLVLEKAFAEGERQLIDAPVTGAGAGIGLIALILAVLMIPAGVLYWRWAYRKPRY